MTYSNYANFFDKNKVKTTPTSKFSVYSTGGLPHDEDIYFKNILKGSLTVDFCCRIEKGFHKSWHLTLHKVMNRLYPVTSTRAYSMQDKLLFYNFRG